MEKSAFKEVLNSYYDLDGDGKISKWEVVAGSLKIAFNAIIFFKRK